MGDRLRKAREVAGYTQRELADQIGIAHRTVTSAERGEHSVRRIVLNAWSLATGVPVAWLTFGDIGSGCHGDGLCAIRDSNPEPADLRPPPEWVTLVDPKAWIVLDYPRTAHSLAFSA
jgi:transcriptional regulator with XRE-family HTH domain